MILLYNIIYYIHYIYIYIYTLGGDDEEEDGEECEGDVSILLSHSMAAQGESSRKRKHRRSAALFPSALLKPISRISFLTAGMGMELEGGALGGLKSVGVMPFPDTNFLLLGISPNSRQSA